MSQRIAIYTVKFCHLVPAHINLMCLLELKKAQLQVLNDGKGMKEHILCIALEIEVANFEDSSWKTRATVALISLAP